MKIHDTQWSSLRKHFLAESLARSFQTSSLNSVVEPTTGDVLVADATGNQARYSFDAQGFVSSVTSPLGRRWRLENDPRGKLLALSDPRGHRLGLSYDSRGALSSVAQGPHKLFDVGYDRQGLLNEIIFPDGTRRSYEYKTPELISVVTNRLGTEVEFEYGSAGLLESIWDGNGHRTRFEYGQWSHPDRVIRADGSQESYVYNPSGLVERIINDSEEVAHVEYDDQNHPVIITYGDGECLSLVYEGSRLVKASTADSIVTYTYDDKGRVIEEEQDGRVLQYAYDETGALAGLTYPTGEQVEFTQDADQRPSSIRSWTGKVYQFKYGADDRTMELSSPNGLVTIIRQSQFGLPISVVTRRDSVATTPALFSYECEHDTESRLQCYKDSDFGSRRFTYDAEGQLLAVDSDNPSQQERFAYDPVGNRVRCNGQRATFDPANRLLQQGNVQCGYDTRGNLVSLRSSSGEWSYKYNFRNLLVEARGPNGQSACFGYDAFGRRIWKRTKTGEVRYIWAGETLISEVEHSNGRTIARDFLYIPGTYTPLAMRVDGQVYSYHTDHRGAPIRLTNELGSVVWAADYSAFGQASVHVERISNPLRLPGQYHDAETGLHYNRFRYYSPLLGRYLSPDPTTYLGGLNFYSYANNDPINSADPQGLWSWSGVVSAVAGAAVGIAVTAAIIATAPVSLPALAVTAGAIVLGGAAAGAVGFGLNEALNQTDFCFLCILKAMARGALIGAVASLPFAFLPATAGVLAFMGAGAASGAIGYIGDYLTNPDAQWSWSDFAWSVGIGAVTAGVGRFLAGKYTQWKQGRNVPSEAPPVETPAPATSEPPPPQPFSRADARDVLVQSEGRQGPGSNVGHAGDHVPLNGEDPAILAESRPKTQTTTYRSGSHAERDLRDIMNANKSQIDALPADGTTTVGGEHTLPQQRMGFHSVQQQAAQPVVFDKVTWRITRLTDGSLHLVHFSPKL